MRRNSKSKDASITRDGGESWCGTQQTKGLINLKHKTKSNI